MTTRSSRRSIVSLTLFLAVAVAGIGRAEIRYSPDITVQLNGSVVTDEQVADDDLAGVIMPVDLGEIPNTAEVDAYAADGSDHLFSLDTTTQLTGGLTVVPADVVRYDGITYSLALDALAEGIPREANVDAVSLVGSDLVLSFDTTVDLGSGVIVADEDLVSFSSGVFVVLFDGSALGLDQSLDLDAVSMAEAGAFYASFDQSGSIGSVTFDDDQLVHYSGSSWSAARDLSSEYDDFGPADLVAVPEPGVGEGVIWGGLLLSALSGRRRHSSSPQ